MMFEEKKNSTYMQDGTGSGLTGSSGLTGFTAPDFGLDDAPVSLDEDSKEESTLFLKSVSGTTFPVHKKTAVALSEVIKTTLDSDPTATELPLDVPDEVMELIVEYISRHTNLWTLSEEQSKTRDKALKEWDEAFIARVWERDQRLLYALITKSYYIDLKSLTILGRDKIISLIKGKDLDQVKKILTPKK